MIFGKTDLGYKAVINATHGGLLSHELVFQPLHLGEKTKGHISVLREDEKIDLTLLAAGRSRLRVAKLDGMAWSTTRYGSTT